MLASASGLAEKPQRIKDMFLVDEKNDAGIYAVKFFIRGKPWVVHIDSDLVFKS